MDQQIASQRGADLLLQHAPSVYEFRERDDMLFACVSDRANVTPSTRCLQLLGEMGKGSPRGYLATRRPAVARIVAERP
jgi:hypothetical protein